MKRRNKQRSQEIELQNLLNERLVDTDLESTIIDEWIIDHNDIEFEKRISEGTFGIVFQGMYKRKIPVAIKKLKINDSRGEFESEVKILKSLRHPVRFYLVTNSLEYYFIYGSMFTRRLQVYCYRVDGW
jgi:predicted Ser/Thr protein kinase